MLKRSMILFVCGAKALLFAAGLLVVPATATADGDCPQCPPPDCYPGDPCAEC